MVFYRCTYIHRSGKICNRECYHPKGCYVHHNSPPQVFCKEYRKLSYFGYEYYNEYARKQTKIIQFVTRKKNVTVIKKILMTFLITLLVTNFIVISNF